MNRILLIFLTIHTIHSCGKKYNSQNMIENQADEYFEIIYKPESSIFSGNYLKIIPANPNFIPTREKQLQVINYLAREYPNNEIKSTLNEKVEFIDSGENFESVECNLCGKNIRTNYWQSAMDKAFEGSFVDLTFQTYCCDKKTSLNDLKYDMPCGFSKYNVEILNPEIEKNKENILSENIKSILGENIKLIWVHY